MKPIRFPEQFNLADYFLFDRLKDGLGSTIAVRFGAREYCYDAVASRTEKLASAMLFDGLRQEERVLVILPDTPPFVWSIFATLRAGAVLAMGNPDAPASDLAHLLRYTRASMLITLPRVGAALREEIAQSTSLRAVYWVPEVETEGADPEGPEVGAPDFPHLPNVLFRTLAAAIAGAGVDGIGHRVATHRDDVAIWLFTSGSTGKSKAAIHTHRDFAFNTEAYAKNTVGYRRGDVTVSVPRLYFGYATGTNLFFPFAVGGTTCLFAERPTVTSLLAAIARHRPTIVTNVPTMLGKILEHDAKLRASSGEGLDLSSIRFSLSAGEALPEALLTRYLAQFGPGCARGGGEVYDGIGSAEMFHIYASNRPGDVKAGSLGRVVAGYEIRILARDAETPGATALPSGEVGVMWVRGDSVALGYHQDRDKSFQTFHGHWCATGDLFRLDADGYLWFGGRADELLKVSGLWVSPLEVEECLMQHRDVALAAVIGCDDEGLLKPKAFVVVREASRARWIERAKEQGPEQGEEQGKAQAASIDRAKEQLVSELQGFVKARLLKHKYPRWIEVVDDLPKNDRGKVDKKLLRARAAQDVLETRDARDARDTRDTRDARDPVDAQDSTAGDVGTGVT
ncbi:MAG: benzoate-CoA ligase family protein [Polyangiales bacterium]